MKGAGSQPPQPPLVPTQIPMPGADIAMGQLPPQQPAPPVDPAGMQPGAGLAAGFDNPGGAVGMPGPTDPRAKRYREMLLQALMGKAMSPAAQPQAPQMPRITLPQRR